MNIIMEAIKNLRKTKVIASTYSRPIFIAGNEVPHRIPAINVSRIAFCFKEVWFICK
jgi:hypothetical protein